MSAAEQEPRPVDDAGRAWIRQATEERGQPRHVPVLLERQQPTYEARDRARALHVQRTIVADCLAGAARAIRGLLELEPNDYRKLAGASLDIAELRAKVVDEERLD